MTTKAVRYPFHVRALDWARDEMHVETDVLSTNNLTTPDDPHHAYVRGRVIDGGRTHRLGFTALILFVVASVLGMASARPGSGPTVETTLGGAAIAGMVAGVALLVIDARRTRAQRRDVTLVLRAGVDARVEPAMIEKWRADTGTLLWIVTEHGFVPEALALARQHSMRCFVANAKSITAVDAA